MVAHNLDIVKEHAQSFYTFMTWEFCSSMPMIYIFTIFSFGDGHEIQECYFSIGLQFLWACEYDFIVIMYKFMTISKI